LRAGAAVEAIAVGGAPCAALRATLGAQARAYADSSHESTKHKLASTLDCERWAQAEVHPRFQTLVDAIVRHTAAPTAELDGGASGAPAVSLVVSAVPYRVVGSALLLVELLGSCVQLTRLFPEVAAHVLAQLAELLSLFNARAFQLVLGAGAIQQAGLQRISSKTLALTSQSLGVVIVLMPHLRASIALHLAQQHHPLLSQVSCGGSSARTPLSARRPCRPVRSRARPPNARLTSTPSSPSPSLLCPTTSSTASCKTTASTSARCLPSSQTSCSTAWTTRKRCSPRSAVR
jgi:hypothetical protein